MKRQPRLIMVDYELNRMENGQKDKAFGIRHACQFESSNLRLSTVRHKKTRPLNKTIKV